MNNKNTVKKDPNKIKNTDKEKKAITYNLQEESFITDDKKEAEYNYKSK